MRYTKYNVATGVKKLWTKTSKLSFTSLSMGIAMLGFAVALPIAALATPPPSSTTVVVTQNSLTAVPDAEHWFFYNDETDTIDNSLGSFVNGPATPPIGNGSAQINVSGTQRRNLATYQFGDTKLSDITALKYSTYNPSAGNGGSANRSGYLNFNVDFDGSDTWQRRLVFLPSDNGTVVQNSWNEWDAVSGGNALYRYSGPTWPGTATSGTTPRTLNDLISSYPGIRTRVSDPWLGIRVGEPYADGYTENIDKFVFGTVAGTTTFDFEAVNQPQVNKDCTKNNWQTFNAPAFASEQECKKWVHSKMNGHLWMSDPSQEIQFKGSNNPALIAGGSTYPNKETVFYTNNDYPGGLSYEADVLCTNSNPATNSARLMWQIPDGHPGLSGLYVVAYVTEGKNATSQYGHSATGDEATARQWCQTGQGFAPTMYTVTQGWVKQGN